MLSALIILSFVMMLAAFTVSAIWHENVMLRRLVARLSEEDEDGA